MKKLVNIVTGHTWTISEKEYKPGGAAGWEMDDGKAVWLDVPAGENPDDCDLVLRPPGIVLNVAKKAARLAKEAAKITRNNNIKAIDLTKNLSSAEVETIVKYLVAELRGD